MKFSPLLLLFLSLFLACTKAEIYGGEEARGLQEELAALRAKGASIDSYQQKGSVALFSFANGDAIRIDVSSIPILTLGVQGFWRRNGALTEVPLDADQVDALFNKDGAIRGVVEGYEEWAFHFDNKEVITIGKSLFASDPDALIRGVNHRGYCVEAPENTLPAYRLSKLNGFHYAEADIRFTSDGVPVLIHDATVDRTSDGTGPVNGLSFDDLRSLDFGGWKAQDFIGTKIPSLEEFLDLCREIDLRPYIELKEGTPAQVDQVVSLVEDRGLRGKAVYISFSSAVLGYVVDCDPTATVGFLTNAVSENSIQTALGLMNGTNRVFVNASDYSDTAVSLCQNASLPLEVWTIDSKAVIQSLSPYITGVTSNRYHAGRVKAL